MIHVFAWDLVDSSLAELRPTAVEHPALARGSHGTPIPGAIVV